MRHQLIFFPDYRHANPYQVLLYESLDGSFHARSGDVEAATRYLENAGLGERVVFHLHWEDAVYRQETEDAPARVRAQAFLDALEPFVERGGLFVWTIHNAEPHDGRHLGLHAELAAKLQLLADRIIVHSPAAAAWLTAARGVEPERIAVVPHGHFGHIALRSREAPAVLRARLGIPAESRVLLLFGRLDGYKGTHSFLDALETLEGPWHAIVAGKQVVPLDERLAALPPGIRARIDVRSGFLEEEALAELLKLADLVVLPYRQILTSGSVMAALGAGRPVIVPATPTLSEIVRDGRNGLLFPPGAEDGLEEALARAMALDAAALAALSLEARRTADGYQWASSGRLTSGLLHGLLARARPQRRLAGPV